VTSSSKRAAAVVVTLVLVGWFLPLALYWWVIGRVPSVSPREAKAALEAPSPTAVLVDVREPERFGAAHLEGAVNWPIGEGGAPHALPDELREKTLFLICDSGIRSARAEAGAARLTPSPVYSVRGGMQAWSRRSEAPRSADTALCKTARG